MIGPDVTRDCSTHFQRYFSKAGLTPDCQPGAPSVRGRSLIIWGCMAKIAKKNGSEGLQEENETRGSLR